MAKLRSNFLAIFFILGMFFSMARTAWGQEMETRISVDSNASGSGSAKNEGAGDGEQDEPPPGWEPFEQEQEEGVTQVSEEGGIPSAPPLNLNLNDCVQMAMLNNKEVKAESYEIEAAEWKLKEAQPRGVPTVEYEFISAPVPRNVDDAVESFFSGNITYFQKGSIRLGAPLYTFGKIHLAQDLAQYGIQAKKENKIEKQNDVVVRVKKLYFGILLARDMRKLLQDAIGHLDDEISRREADKKNPADPIEAVRLKLYRFEVLSRLTQLEQKDYLAKEGLRMQIGLPRGTYYEIAERHLNPVDYELKDFEYYLGLSQKFQPKTRLLNIGLDAKEKEYQLEKRKAAPNIGIGGFYEFGVAAQSITGLVLTDDYNDPFNFNRVGVGLRIKGEFNGKEYRAKVRQTEAQYFKTAMQKSAAEEGLELDLRETYSSVKLNGENLENNRKAMKTARQFVFLTKSNLDIGIGEKDDYADALQAYLVSRGRYLEAIFNYNIAVATLESKIGGTALAKQ
jgi:outer membrane protein TolC